MGFWFDIFFTTSDFPMHGWGFFLNYNRVF